MKYCSKSNTYKNSTDTNYFDPEQLIAISYGWWLYLKPIGRELVFNTYSYSPTTVGHQSRLRSLLYRLNIKPTMYIEAPNGLQDISRAIDHYYYLISRLTDKINQPKTYKAKNLERHADILKYGMIIDWLKEIQK